MSVREPLSLPTVLTVRAVHVAVVQLVLLLALGLLLRWTPLGWLGALGSAALLDAATVRIARARGADALGAADGVTLLRATLTCGVAALVVESWGGAPHRAAAVTVLAAVSLALDWVDGKVARRTGGGSAFGGQFDGEADAFLLLVLSVWVAPLLGWWVLVVGLARYVFGAAGLVMPWMRVDLPYRYWRKVVTAAAGVALVVAAAEVAPRPLVIAALLGALLLVAESFTRDVWWLWTRRALPAMAPAAERGTP